MGIRPIRVTMYTGGGLRWQSGEAQLPASSELPALRHLDAAIAGATAAESSACTRTAGAATGTALELQEQQLMMMTI